MFDTKTLTEIETLPIGEISNEITSSYATFKQQNLTYPGDIAKQYILNTWTSWGDIEKRQFIAAFIYIEEHSAKELIEIKQALVAIMPSLGVNSKQLASAYAQRPSNSKQSLVCGDGPGLDALVGLETVKNNISKLIDVFKVNIKRVELGLKPFSSSNHFVFEGNPGTGKTTVARLLGDILKDIGILKSGHVVEVDRSGLVGEYVGHTAVKTKEKIEQALGGILFIDEAYALHRAKSESDFGGEAIEILLKAMEDKRDQFIVIAAGYSEPMESFLRANPGLGSRFSNRIKFEDYSSEQLFDIFESIANSHEMDLAHEMKEAFTTLMTTLKENSGSHFGNARMARLAFEASFMNMSQRANEDGVLEEDEISLLQAQDLPSVDDLLR